MSEVYGLFNSVDGDREYLDDSVNAAVGGIAGNAGIVATFGGALKAEMGSGLQLTIESGFAFGGIPAGWWYYLDEQEAVTLGTVTSGYQRKDLIVLKLDRNVDVRTFERLVIIGDEAESDPIARALTQNETEYEVPICEVLLDETGILSVTDTRVFANTNGGFIENSEIDEGYAVMYNAATASYIANQSGYMLSTGRQFVVSGNVVSLPNLQLTKGYNYYIQADGSIATTTSTRLAGYALGEDLFLVNFDGDGGLAMDYTENMTTFFATPGSSGTVRLKVEIPETAGGVMIYRDTSAYDGEGTGNWGTLVANITDDSDYSGDNEWLIDDDDGNSLISGTTYYYKAFPYLNGAYNETEGMNEWFARAGILSNEYTMDNISGDSIVDDAGSSNATASGVIFQEGKIGNGAYATGAGYATDSHSLLGKSISFWIYGTSGTCGILGLSTSCNDPNVYRSGSTLYAGYWGYPGSGTWYGKTATLASGWNHVVLSYNSAYTSVTVYVNGVSKGSGTIVGGGGDATTSDAYINRLFYTNINTYSGTDAEYYLYSYIDQMRFYSSNLILNEVQTLYNGGNGC